MVSFPGNFGRRNHGADGEVGKRYPTDGPDRLGCIDPVHSPEEGRGGFGGNGPPEQASEAVTGARDGVLRAGFGPLHGGRLWGGAALPDRGLGGVGSARPAFTPDCSFEHLAGPPTAGV